MLWTCGLGRPCGPQWCSKEATTQRCGLTGENLVRPASCMSSSAARFAAQAWDQIAWALSHSCPAASALAGVIGLDSGLEQLAVLGGQVGGGFPDQVGELAAGRQLLHGGGVDVGAQGQAVIGAGQAGPRAGWLVGIAVLQDVRQPVADPGQPQHAARPGGGDAGELSSRSPPGSSMHPAPSICGLQVGVTVGGALQDLRGRRDLGFGRLQDRVLARSGPGRERRAEVTVVRVLGRDHQALPVGERGGERAVRGGQVLDPRGHLAGRLVRGQGELVALGVGGGLGFGGPQRRVVLGGVAAA